MYLGQGRDPLAPPRYRDETTDDPTCTCLVCRQKKAGYLVAHPA